MRGAIIVLVLAAAVVFIASTQAQSVSIKRRNANILPRATVTAVPTPTIDKVATVDIAVTTPTVMGGAVSGKRLAVSGENPINPTLRDCDYYFAQWGRRRARGTEADPFPVNKRVPLKVGCRIVSEEVNRVVNGR